MRSGVSCASADVSAEVAGIETGEVLKSELDVQQNVEPQPSTASGDAPAPHSTARRQGRKRRQGRVWLLAFAILLIVAGAGLVAYPTVANWYNQLHATRAVGVYVGAVEDSSSAQLDEIRAAADAYNQQLVGGKMDFDLTDAELEAYNALMSFETTDVMATVQIPSLGVVLPVYHGTSDDVMRAGVGHLAGSSLPVGGAGTHCVLIGHRGLPSARLFTDLDKLEVGNTFCVSSLGVDMWYEVDQVLVVLPDELDALAIEPGQDLCTLVTCTPYGVNSHRLLVRGHRIDSDGEGVIVTSDAYRLNPVGVACVLCVPVLAVVGVGVYVRHRRIRQNVVRLR